VVYSILSRGIDGFTFDSIYRRRRWIISRSIYRWSIAWPVIAPVRKSYTKNKDNTCYNNPTGSAGSIIA
jgi:hypothetical protein